MNKKAIYSILSTIVAMIVLSVSLVFAIGPHVSADSEPFVVLDKAEYFNIDNGVLCGISQTGLEYAGGYENWKVIIPEGVVEITGIEIEPEDGGGCWNSLDCVVCNTFCGGDHTISLKLPKSLKRIGNYAFGGLYRLSELEIPYGVTSIGDNAFGSCLSLKSIVIPASVAEIGKFNLDVWQFGFENIVVQNLDLMVNEHLLELVNGNGVVLRYEAPQNVPEDPSEPEQPENPEQNQPEILVDENDKVNNQNNKGLIVGIAGTAAGILIVAGIVFGIVIAKRRRK